MGELIELLRFSVAQGRRAIIGAGPRMTESIFDSIAKRVEAIADAEAIRLGAASQADTGSN